MLSRLKKVLVDYKRCKSTIISVGVYDQGSKQIPKNTKKWYILHSLSPIYVTKQYD